MDLNKLSKNELEQMSYADLSYILLKENNKPMATAQLFRKVCDLLEYSDALYSEKIGDFYTSLTTDKRFLFLDSSEWDLREKNIVKMEFEEDEEDEEEIEEEIEEELDDIDSDITDEDLDDDDEDLSIVTEEDMDEE